MGLKRKRLGYRKGRKGGSRTGATESSKQLAVYINPFSVATQQPKIPDGSKNFSLGSSFRSQSVLTMDAANQYATIIVYPACSSFGAAMVHAAAAGQIATPFTQAGVNNVTFFSVSTEMGLPTGAPGDVDFQMPELESWRMVSAGIKISCINNSLANDGYWQAIRLRQCQVTTGLVGDGEGIMPNLTSYPPVTGWPNDPTFSSGRLRDIGKKSFMLAQNGEHHWRDWGTGNLNVEIDENAHYWFDDSLDIIIIRISAAANTQLLINGFGNYEHAWNSDTMLNHYMTQTMQVSPATLQQAQNKKKYLTRKAAT